MGKINCCLKCLFNFFNSMFITLGFLLLIGAVRSLQLPDIDRTTLVWSFLLAFGILGVHILGVHAGCTEKIWLLNVFAGLMVVGLIIYTILGVIVAVEREQIESIPEELQPDVREMMDWLIKVVMGTCFGFAVTYFLGLLATCQMVSQVRRHDGGGGGRSIAIINSV